LAEQESSFPCPKCSKETNKSDAKEPPKIYGRYHGMLRIHCEFSPCDFVCELKDIAEHEPQCEHNPVNSIFCDKLCGIRLSSDDVENHKCGDFFFGEINKLQQRVQELENQVQTLKDKKHSLPASSNSISSSSPSSMIVKYPATNGGDWRSPNNYSSSPFVQLGPFGKSLKKMIYNMKNFDEEKIFDLSIEWKEDSLYKLLKKVVSTVELGRVLDKLDVRGLYDVREFNATTDSNVGRRGLKFLITLASLEYLCKFAFLLLLFL